MSNSAIKPSRRLASCHYALLLLPMRARSRFRLLHLLFSLHIILFLIVYHRFILITPSSIEPIDPNTNGLCYIPQFDPWDQTIAKSKRLKPLYRCPTQKRNLINVVDNTHLIINQTVNRTSFAGSVTHCLYMKVDRNPEAKLFRDWSYTLSEPILITNGRSEAIRDADFVLTRCFNDRRRHFNGEHFWWVEGLTFCRTSRDHRASLIEGNHGRRACEMLAGKTVCLLLMLTGWGLKCFFAPALALLSELR